MVLRAAAFTVLVDARQFELFDDVVA